MSQEVKITRDDNNKKKKSNVKNQPNQTKAIKHEDLLPSRSTCSMLDLIATLNPVWEDVAKKRDTEDLH